jgi:predicted acetyltransferase
MSQTYSVNPPVSSDELAALLNIISVTFNFPRDGADRYAGMVGQKNFRVLRMGDGGADSSADPIIGGLALIPMGQFFGRQSVPMQGVAVVCVAPEHRASGAATILMCEVVRELNVNGCALSTLYPATLPLYRRAGYEHAGTRCEIRIPTKSIKSAETAWPVKRIAQADLPAIESLYRRRAIHAPGMVDRGPFLWHRVRSPRGETAQGFMVINPATNLPEAYTYYVQKESSEAPYSLQLSDLVAASPAAGRRLLTFFAQHRTMADAVIYNGNIDDPFLKLLSERGYQAKLGDHWMLRIVDVGAALSRRGYSSSLSTELHLDIEDDVIVSNNGRYVLQIDQGRPTVHTGGQGDLRLDIRGLAALYSGHQSPYDLLITGQLHLAPHIKTPDAMLERLATTFAGPAPSMTDGF